jgi:hypothetical protein
MRLPALGDSIRRTSPDVVFSKVGLDARPPLRTWNSLQEAFLSMICNADAVPTGSSLRRLLLSLSG